jgi:NADH-quinone oxidoreductase subunit N
MNSIIFSAVFGVIMMFCSFLIDNKSYFRHIAAVGLLLLLAVNVLDTNGVAIFHIDVYKLLAYTRFGLFFNSIAIASTLIYVLLK